MSTDIVQGDSLAAGFALGPLRIPAGWTRIPLRTGSAVPDPRGEVDRFREQVEALGQEIEEAVGHLESEAFCDEAEILRVHLTMLRDPELHRQVLELIQCARHRAETAVEQVLESMAAMFACADDPILAERAADLRDLAMRLQARLGNRPVVDVGAAVGGSDGAILALPELLPSLVLEARDAGVAGFVVESGTSVSHGMILAKSFGIPVVRIQTLDALRPFAGRSVLVWGEGEVLVEPDEAELRARRPARETIPVARAPGAPQTRVWISIVDPRQLEIIDWTGIEGVGLYRSEALFLRYREDFPSEAEQLAVYRRLFRLAGHRPVVFRTADLGADKPVEHMRFGPQDNPCLGLRAHRLFRFHPEILLTQIRAVLQAAHGGHRLKLMYPMIESIEQLRFVQGLVDKAIQSLVDEGLAFQRDFLEGVLIETPSAAWSFGRLLAEVDFASVGTNDLVQYLFAVERNAANVADLYQPEHPIALQVIRSLAEQAAAAGKPLSICGEIAADTALLPVLVGLGVADISVATGAGDAVRQTLADLDAAGCERLAKRCLQADTVNEVRALLGKTSKDDEGRPMVGEGEALDPVCGMVVYTRDTSYVLRVVGGTRYFCSKFCLDRFMSGPNDDRGN